MANIYILLPSSNAVGFLFWSSLFISPIYYPANHTALIFTLYHAAEGVTNDVNGRCIIVELSFVISGASGLNAVISS